MIDIHRKVQSLQPQPQPAQGARSDNPENTPKSVYHYPSLGPTTETNVRILNILSDTKEESPIRCDLEVCSLKEENAIPEALSYVWGTDLSNDPIFVGGNPFFITKNLHTILRGLRRRDVNRRIWVDAICINQEDLEEKTHQIRLMRDIYTKAGDTIVWLNEHQGPLRDEDQPLYASHSGPLREGYGGFEFDQYDLVAILNECLKYPAETPKTEESLIAYTMLDLCKNRIFLNEWWRRVWTLQEATLPRKAPTIHYRGHTFSFDDLFKALRFFRTVIPFGERSEEILRESRSADLRTAADAIKRTKSRVLDRIPMLLEYRPGLQRQERRSEIKTFTSLLGHTSHSRATNPRDKIFALESLLPERGLGELINVDYSEDISDVFRRATARSFNSPDSGQLHLMVYFNFLFESQSRKGENLSGPSWVLDLTYSDAPFRCNKVTNWNHPDGVTLDGYLFSNKSALSEQNITNMVTFTTPECLYCAGCVIDQVSWIGNIRTLKPEDAFEELQMFALWVNLARRAVLGLGVPSDYFDRLKMLDNPDRFRITSFTRFLTLLADQDTLNFIDLNGFSHQRNSDLAGRTCFITTRGHFGIATAPIRLDDKLCWIDTAPVYLVLRNADNNNEGTSGMQQHRIVARAAISESLSTMWPKIYILPIQRFQIV
ncbi:hypothetical protein SLS62_001126 [Diatrype stigma]|uniref:Heterokaryon incompatibility domain-containing protein n=1 Tax=Diatrype stigma TaxID=117547 RepID=A0AAN9V239_9PEZI